MSCTASLRRKSDGLSTTPFGPFTLKAPQIYARGINDVGVSNGRRYFEVYGEFPGPQVMRPNVYCNWSPSSTRTEYLSTGQINVSIPDPGVGAVCSVSFTRTTDRMQSPAFGPIKTR